MEYVPKSIIFKNIKYLLNLHELLYNLYIRNILVNG